MALNYTTLNSTAYSPLAYGNVPPAISGILEPFTVYHSDSEIAEMKTLLDLSRIGPETWWNQQDNITLGISRNWLIQSKDTWLNDFDWRRHEADINSVPNFKIDVNDTLHGELGIHFLALFSADPEATPLLFMHGWPGSVLEFLPLLNILSDKYTPETLPYNVIVPSLPGYAWSTPVSPENEFTLNDAARVMNEMMIELGFGQGYVAQGGDVGSAISCILLRDHPECKAAHVNTFPPAPNSFSLNDPALTPEEVIRFEKAIDFQATGLSYAAEQGTRPATAGLAMSSSPLSLLAWMGEKLLAWAGVPIPIDNILADISIYWLTSAFPSGLYPYPFLVTHPDAWNTSTVKPLGYSNFPQEFNFYPKAIAERVYPNLIQYTTLPVGGHFAAWEVPQLLLQDVESFVQKVAGIV